MINIKRYLDGNNIFLFLYGFNELGPSGANYDSFVTKVVQWAKIRNIEIVGKRFDIIFLERMLWMNRRKKNGEERVINAGS